MQQGVSELSSYIFYLILIMQVVAGVTFVHTIESNQRIKTIKRKELFFSDVFNPFNILSLKYKKYTLSPITKTFAD